MINILVDWLNFKRLHCRHSKIVKWLNQTKHTLTSYHVFQKETVNMCFKQKEKKEKNVKSKSKSQK